MTRIEKLNNIQNKAVEAWFEKKCGTIKLAARMGKTIVSFKCILRLYDEGFIKLGDKIRFRAEIGKSRKKVIFEEERKAGKEILGRDIFEMFNCDFYTYQSGPRLDNVIFEVYDECDVISEQSSQVILQSKAKYKLGLTGTVSNPTSIFRTKLNDTLRNNVSQTSKEMKLGKLTERITKGQFLELKLPIVFEYETHQAIADGILCNFQTILITHTLSKKLKYLQLTKKYNTLMSEQDYYNKCEVYSKQYYKPEYVRRIYSKKMVDLLYYNMESKKLVLKKLLSLLEGKTLVFSVGKKLLEGCVDLIADSKNVEEAIELFRKGKIKTLGSSKIIGRGISFPEVENIVFVSYYSTSTDMIQKLSRALLYKEGKIANIYFIITNGTYEANSWFPKINKIYNSKKEVISEFQLNVKKIVDSRSLYLPNFKL